MNLKKFSLVFLFAATGLATQSQAMMDETLEANRGHYLTEKEISAAEDLEYKSKSKIENFTQTQGEPKGWLTIADYDFQYKKPLPPLCVANSFDCFNPSIKYGQIVLFEDPIDGTTKEKNLYLTSVGDFSDHFGQRILSFLRYEYVPGEKPFFIIHKVETAEEFKRNGYSQACLSYFFNEFVVKRTDCKLAFSDLVNPATRIYFPKYGFIKGWTEGFSEENVHRVEKYPYHWIKKETGEQK